MKIKSAPSLLALFLLIVPDQAFADSLEVFNIARTFAYKTMRIALEAKEASAIEEVRRGKTPRPGPIPAQSGLDVKDIETLIKRKARRYSINPAFVKAVVAVESGFIPRARSWKGAMGLMQLMPATALALGVNNPWDPEENLEAGIRYLASLLWEFRSVEAALIAYHAGPGVVQNGGRVPGETKSYVKAVLRRFAKSGRR